MFFNDNRSIESSKNILPNIDNFKFEMINKNILLNDQKLLSEIFTIFASCHYRNSPNDLKILLDSKKQYVFVLKDLQGNICTVIQAAVEGGIDLNQSTKEGNLISCMLYNITNNVELSKCYGLRIVRIATRIELQSKGYGSKIMKELELLVKSDISLKIFKRKISWIGVSFGLSEPLLRFWNKLNFLPIKINNKISEKTGEFNIICIKGIDMSFDDICKQNLYKFINQCGLCYRTLPISLILTFIYTCNQKLDYNEVLTSKEIEDMNLVIKGDTDLNNFLYLIPKITRICFYNIYDGNLNVIEQAVLAGVGLQMKSINEVAKEINYSSMGTIRLFQEIFKKTLKK